MKVFSRLPGRLAFLIRDAVPVSALAAGHIFLGFSKCGQYLISYTQTTTEGEPFDINFNYYYRLHWWLFTPYGKARKVAEVTLFANQGVYGNLNITFCQWPRDHNRVVVFGYHGQEGEEAEMSAGSQHCFLTVTAVPSLGNCKDCIRVANTYDTDDMAEAWNSCVRMSCLLHGVTVHTQFDIVAPYPKFEPKISLKRDNCVVVNTGNFLHSITVELEQLGAAGQPEQEREEASAPSSVRMNWLHPLSPPAPLHPISVHVGTAEFSLNSMLGSPAGPGQFSPASFLHTSDSDLTDGESEASQPTARVARAREFSELLQQGAAGPRYGLAGKQLIPGPDRVRVTTLCPQVQPCEAPGTRAAD
jgi:DDB1- and CUL4-associated factor 15